METKKYLDEAGLSYYHSKIKGLIDEKVDAEEGKGLSSNDFTDSDKTKLEELPEITTIGANLDLTDGVLSATGGGAAYTAGTGLELNGNEFSIDNTVALKSEIPTVNNATLTIQKNGAAVDTFTANASSDKTINITVPTTAADVSALPASTKYGASIVLSINSTTYVVTATLKDQDGNTLGSSQTIDLPLESVVVSGSYDSQTKEVVLTLQSGSTIRFSVADLVSGLQTEITAQNKLSADLVDDSTTTNKFVTASDKTTWSGKQDALTAGSNITISDNTISATDTTYSSFVGATSLADGSAGLVPAPLIADAGEYLKGDGTWDTPPNTTYSDFTGATSSVAGSAGLVPAPAAGDQNKYLKGDGAWSTVTPELVEMSYGESNAWAKFIAAYNAKCIVYCRASSNANPASGTQTRKAFMAYVNDDTSPTSVEFQYVRSVSSKTDSQQTDQVFVYTLTSAGGGTWSVTSRNMGPKISVDSSLTKTFSNGANATLTLSANAMTGATSGAAGTAGYVPAPAAGDQSKYLKGDGTWSALNSAKVNAKFMQTGSGSITYQTQGSAGGGVNVTFDVAFDHTPIVVASTKGPYSANAVEVHVQTPTTTGFSILARTAGGTQENGQFQWIAVDPLANILE